MIGLGAASWAGSAVAAAAAAPGWGVSLKGEGGRIGYAVHSPVSQSGGEGAAGHRPSRPTPVRPAPARIGPPPAGPAAPLYWAGFGLGTGPGGRPCAQSLYRHFRTPTAASNFVAIPGLRAVWLYRLSRVGGSICPGASGPPSTVGGQKAATAPRPATAAANWWSATGSKQLPAPVPWVAPGWALAGNPGFLVDRAPASRSFSVPFPGLGTLSVRASSVLYVDWGDGQTSGPYQPPGLPWPSGAISHVWQQAGVYTVTVTQDWFATWSLAGESGYLSGLSTTAQLPSFQVRQLVSVRDR